MTMRKPLPKIFVPLIAAAMLAGCIKNDIPYPRLVGRITDFEVRDQKGEAVIDSVARTVTVDMNETAVLSELRLLRFEVTPHTSISPEITDSLIDLSSPRTFSLTTWPDQSYTEYAGQAVQFTVTFVDGTETEVTDYNPFLIIDGTGWRTAYAPCEALNRFANELLRERGG